MMSHIDQLNCLDRSLWDILKMSRSFGGIIVVPYSVPVQDRYYQSYILETLTDNNKVWMLAYILVQLGATKTKYKCASDWRGDWLAAHQLEIKNGIGWRNKYPSYNQRNLILESQGILSPKKMSRNCLDFWQFYCSFVAYI